MARRNALSAWLAAAALALVGCSGTDDLVIHSAEDATEARLGAMVGSTGESYLEQGFPKARRQSFDDVLDSVAALKAGQLDAVITALPTALQIVKHNPDLYVLQERLTNEDTAIAMRKGNEALLAKVNDVINTLEADGTLADMARRWYKTDLSPYQEPDVPQGEAGPVLRIGVAATREPVSFIDADGRVSGHEGELARRIGQALGRPVEFSNMKFGALIPALQSGKIDMIVTGMSSTPERAKFVDFTRSYYANAQVFIIRRDASHPDLPPPVLTGPGGAQGNASAAAAVTGTAGFRQADDVKEMRVGVLLGSAHESFVTRDWPGAQVLTYQTTPDVVLAVRTGKVDAGISDTDPLRTVLDESPELAMFGEPVLRFDLGVGFSKQSAALRSRFNDFLRKLEADGTLPDMRRRWIEGRGRTMPELGPAPGGDVLVVGTAAEGLPFEAIVDNQLVGFDIEMMERFGREIGRPVRFDNLVFGSLVAGVASGKVDAIAASIFVTEERKKLIDFSDAYYQATSSVFALRSAVAPDAASPVPAAKGGAPLQAEGAAAGAAGRGTDQGFLASVSRSFQANILAEQRYLLIWDGLKVTVLLSILSTIFGTLLGALVCYMRMSTVRLLNVPAKVYISVLRGTPVLVLLMMIFYVVFASIDINPIMVAVFAFGLNFAAYAAEIFRSGIEGIDKGQTEAGIAMGFTRVQTFLHVVLPQTLQRILPVYKGEFISMVKMTSIVGYIAVQDLTKASDIIRSRTFDAFFPLVMVAILYFLISWILLQALEHLERRMDPKARRARAVRS
jgi:polar amino acid transport system substrate-binding protein